MDINTETLAILPDMAFSSISVPDITMAQQLGLGTTSSLGG